MTAAWNPQGLPVVNAEDCKKIIEAVARYPKYWKADIVRRRGLDCFGVRALESGGGFVGGASVILSKDVEAVRAMVAT